MAAVLACGGQAVLSHRSAARLWGIADAASPRIDVTSLAERARHLPPNDTTRLGEIPVTTIARTLFDLAEVIDRSALEGAFEAAERIGLLDTRELLLTCQRNPGRRAHKRLLSLLPSLSPAEPTRSELERLFRRLCRITDVPTPQINVLVEGYEVDAFWPVARRVCEVDSWEFHKTRAAFERDRVRDAGLLVAGYRVVRVTYRQLRYDPAGVARTVRHLLAAAA
jgi:very-short-patch-repair endonuclease